ncbi:hypothetical protein [Kribbella sp. CA-294648]|uniref:GHMP family kinase ATP-binding protein n=1 Tax=Kribbella sp. CA-294648 TaxID=3239948 RepID=UPI003D8BCB93
MARRSCHWKEADLPGSASPVAVRASAPLRVDCGNALDLATIATILQPYDPCTLNLAVNLRVEVTVEEQDGTCIVVDDETGVTKFGSAAELSLAGATRLTAVILHHFQLEGVRVTIRSPVPRGSGLGGSGAVALSLVAACQTYRRLPAQVALSSAELPGLAMLAQSLEAAITPAPVGLQDHLAAAFGGVSLWEWDARDRMPPFRRIPIQGASTVLGLNSRLVVGVLREPHVDGGLSRSWSESVRQGELAMWIRTAEVTRHFAEAVSAADWAAASAALDEECELRVRRWPQVMKGAAVAFRRAVVACDGAARFCGGGDGGAVWALIPPHRRQEFEEAWRTDPACPDVVLLTPEVDTEGLVIECRPS